MKRQVVHIHGGDSFNSRLEYLSHLKSVPIWDLPGNPKTLFWKRSLAEDLGDQFEVFMPTMPNAGNADYTEWKVWFERHFTYLRDGAVLIGHSLGGMFLAKYLSEHELPFRVSQLYVLGAPGGEWPEQSDGNNLLSFKFSPELAKNISSRAKNVEFWHSEDDHIVPVAEANWYKIHATGATIRIFKDKNHFLVPTLPELIAGIQSH